MPILSSTLRAMTQFPPQALATATALPAEVFIDEAALARDRVSVFGRYWQCVTAAEFLREPGDQVAEEIAGSPVVIVRDDEGRLRAFHNVCRHRAGPVAVGRSCSKRLRCRYHGWSYGLDGKLLSAPEMGGVEGFDPTQIRLSELAVAEWNGLVFVAEHPAVGIDALLEGISERAGTALHGLKFARRVSYTLNCDWKLYVENYLEGYHVPHVHPELNRMLDYRSYRTELTRWHSLQWSPLERGSGPYAEGEALYWFVFPNTMLNLLPGRLQTNRVLPLGAGRCRVDFDYYYPHDTSLDSAGDLAFSDGVQDEDRQICEAVQHGLASGVYQPGRLNPLRESGVHHFHELLRECWREVEPTSPAAAESVGSARVQ